LITDKKHDKYNQTKLGDLYIMTHSNTQSKKNLLQEIAKELGVSLTVEIL